MTVAIIVPLDVETFEQRGVRGEVWTYVRSHLITQHPNAALCSGAVDASWCKAEAVEAALSRADGADVLVVHDADVIVAPAYLNAAIRAVQAGVTKWAVPHGPVHRYDERSTAEFIRGEHGRQPTLTRWAYSGIAGGGIVVLGCDTYRDCPLDRRFTDWGGEDQAWGWALGTLHGQPWRGDVQLVHLWHPHASGNRNPQRPVRLESERLRRAYRNVRGNEPLMRDLVAAGR